MAYGNFRDDSLPFNSCKDDPVSQERCSSGRASPCSGRESPKGRTGTGIWEDFRDMAILDQHVGVDSDSLYVSIGLCEFLHMS